MSTFMLSTAWQKLVDGPTRVQIMPRSEVEYSMAPAEKRDSRWSFHSSILGGETKEIDVPVGETLSIRLASRIDVLALVDLPAVVEPRE